MERMFEKGYIGTCQIKNRIVLPPATTGFAGLDGQPTPHLIKYYEERAKGGVGLIYTEIFQVDTVRGRAGLRQLHTGNSGHLTTLNQMVTTVHQYGTKIFAQLHHGGNTNSPLLNEGVIYSASNVPTVTGIIPEPLTVEQIEELVKKFASTAAFCKAAGFDGVEIHGAHGYLIDQFLSASTNLRTDQYGGSLENRCRFPVEIISAIKAACGKDYPVTIRLSVNEYDPSHPGSITLADGVEIAKRMEAAGVDAISVSCCNYFSTDTAIEPYSYAQGWRKDNSKAIKNAVSIPVISTNTIKTPEFAESLLEEEYCDFIAIARPLLADPQWVRKAKEGRSDEIRKCIGCLYCFESLGAGNGVRCSLNPRLGSELIFDESPIKDGNGESVVVIGGGPAGMQAASTLAQRGFAVTLFEQNSELGGAMCLAAKTAPYKDKIQWFIDTLVNETKRTGVDIRLNTRATVDEVRKLNPTAVFLACGADPVVPKLPGIDSKKVVMAADVLQEKVKVSGKVVVIGGGLTGLETAEYLCNTGHAESMTVVDMLPALGAGLYFVVFMDVMKQLAPHKPNLMPGHKIDAVTESGVLLTKMDNGEQVHVDADYVVLSMGLKPNQGMIREYEAAFERVIVLGENEKAPGRIATSVKSGYVAAYGFDPKV